MVGEEDGVPGGHRRGMGKTDNEASSGLVLLSNRLKGCGEKLRNWSFDGSGKWHKELLELQKFIDGLHLRDSTTENMECI